MSITYQVEDGVDLSEFLGAVAASWAEVLSVPVSDVKATAAASSNRRRLAARKPVAVEVEALLSEGDNAAAYVECIESSVCVTQSVVTSPFLITALGLDPADPGPAGAVSVNSVTVVSATPGPTPPGPTPPGPTPTPPGPTPSPPPPGPTPPGPTP